MAGVSVQVRGGAVTVQITGPCTPEELAQEMRRAGADQLVKVHIMTAEEAEADRQRRAELLKHERGCFDEDGHLLPEARRFFDGVFGSELTDLLGEP